MTAKFDAFKAALHALCIEHGVRIHSGDGYDDYGVYVQPGTDAYPAGSHVELEDCIPLTPEEQAAENARQAEQRATWARRREEERAADEARYRAAIESGDYVKLCAAIEAERQEQRKKNMRVTRIPGDQHYIGDRPCRVWCNEVEVTDWTVADDFRRVVEMPGGVLHGAVRIDLATLAPEVELYGETIEEAFKELTGNDLPAPRKPNAHIPARKRKAGK